MCQTCMKTFYYNEFKKLSYSIPTLLRRLSIDIKSQKRGLRNQHAEMPQQIHTSRDENAKLRKKNKKHE